MDIIFTVVYSLTYMMVQFISPCIILNRGITDMHDYYICEYQLLNCFPQASNNNDCVINDFSNNQEMREIKTFKTFFY